jgi:hypothetical protein
MLRRVNAGLYEEDESADVELAVKAANNGGVEAATFDYDSAILPPHPIEGHPGCQFTVNGGIRQFRVLVVFNPAAPASARYDLFQVNGAGVLVPVAGKSVTNNGGTPLIGFGIDGLAAAADAGKRAGRRKARKPSRPKPKKTMARRAAKKKPVARKSKPARRKASRKMAKKR